MKKQIVLTLPDKWIAFALLSLSLVLGGVLTGHSAHAAPSHTRRRYTVSGSAASSFMGLFPGPAPKSDASPTKTPAKAPRKSPPAIISSKPQGSVRFTIHDKWTGIRGSRPTLIIDGKGVMDLGSRRSRVHKLVSLPSGQKLDHYLEIHRGCISYARSLAWAGELPPGKQWARFGEANCGLGPTASPKDLFQTLHTAGLLFSHGTDRVHHKLTTRYSVPFGRSEPGRDACLDTGVGMCRGKMMIWVDAHAIIRRAKFKFRDPKSFGHDLSGAHETWTLDFLHFGPPVHIGVPPKKLVGKLPPIRKTTQA